MKAKLIAIGNSRGIRLPKAMVEQCGLAEEIELEVKGDRLIVSSPKTLRRGWDSAFARMRRRGDDRLLDITAPTVATNWDETEWTW
jgi:antitoxin MazE